MIKSLQATSIKAEAEMRAKGASARSMRAKAARRAALATAPLEVVEEGKVAASDEVAEGVAGLCGACAVRWQDGCYCPVCMMLWEDSDGDMLGWLVAHTLILALAPAPAPALNPTLATRCECGSWVHLTCEKLSVGTATQWEQLAYSCPKCRCAAPGEGLTLPTRHAPARGDGATYCGAAQCMPHRPQTPDQQTPDRPAAHTCAPCLGQASAVAGRRQGGATPL